MVNDHRWSPYRKGVNAAAPAIGSGPMRVLGRGSKKNGIEWRVRPRPNTRWRLAQIFPPVQSSIKPPKFTAKPSSHTGTLHQLPSWARACSPPTPHCANMVSNPLSTCRRAVRCTRAPSISTKRLATSSALAGGEAAGQGLGQASGVGQQFAIGPFPAGGAVQPQSRSRRTPPAVRRRAGAITRRPSFPAPLRRFAPAQKARLTANGTWYIPPTRVAAKVIAPSFNGHVVSPFDEG